MRVRPISSTELASSGGSSAGTVLKKFGDHPDGANSQHEPAGGLTSEPDNAPRASCKHALVRHSLQSGVEHIGSN